MLTESPTTPSRITTRRGGSVSTGVGFTAGTMGVGITAAMFVVVGSVPGVTGIVGGRVLVVVAGGGTTTIGAAIGLGTSRWDATKPKAFVGASISVQSPLLPMGFTLSPLASVPMTLKFSPAPLRMFNFAGTTL